MLIQDNFHGNGFNINLMGSDHPHLILNSFVFEKEVREKYWNIKEGDLVIDVGAAYGSWVLPALACGAITVLAFEPDRDCLFDLMSNLYVNNWNCKCLVYPILVTEHNSVPYRPFYPKSHSEKRCEGEFEGRHAIALDDVVFKAGLPKVDWIKVDVEGAEFEVLTGATRLLTEMKPVVIVEVHEDFVPGLAKNVNLFMKKLGYTGKLIWGNKHRNSMMLYEKTNGNGKKYFEKDEVRKLMDLELKEGNKT